MAKTIHISGRRVFRSKSASHSDFMSAYSSWEARLLPTMREAHPAGERLFVDYAGHTVEMVDGSTGELRAAQVFVAVLGASNYTYAEATWTQSLPDWTGSHVRTLAFLGGAPRQIVPDNLRAEVLRASWYEPGINPTYRDLAAHCGTAILPARVRRPRDKAKVRSRRPGCRALDPGAAAPSALLLVVELNAAIASPVADLNIRPMHKLGVSRRQLFEQLDQPALAQLPAEPFVYAEWRIRRVSLDYHVDVEGHYYSVPHHLPREQVEARITARTIELFHKGERVAVHVRGGACGRQAIEVGAATARLAGEQGAPPAVPCRSEQERVSPRAGRCGVHPAPGPPDRSHRRKPGVPGVGLEPGDGRNRLLEHALYGPRSRALARLRPSRAGRPPGPRHTARWTHISLTGDYLWREPAAGADDFLPLRLNERLSSVA